MTTEEELKKELENLKKEKNQHHFTKDIEVIEAELKGFQEGRAEAYKKCIEILSLHNIGIKEVEWRVREYLNEIKGDGK